MEWMEKRWALPEAAIWPCTTNRTPCYRKHLQLQTNECTYPEDGSLEWLKWHSPLESIYYPIEWDLSRQRSHRTVSLEWRMKHATTHIVQNHRDFASSYRYGNKFLRLRWHRIRNLLSNGCRCWFDGGNDSRESLLDRSTRVRQGWIVLNNRWHVAGNGVLHLWRESSNLLKAEGHLPNNGMSKQRRFGWRNSVVFWVSCCIVPMNTMSITVRE